MGLSAFYLFLQKQKQRLVTSKNVWQTLGLQSCIGRMNAGLSQCWSRSSPAIALISGRNLNFFVAPVTTVASWCQCPAGTTGVRGRARKRAQAGSRDASGLACLVQMSVTFCRTRTAPPPPLRLQPGFDASGWRCCCRRPGRSGQVRHLCHAVQ